MTFYCDVCNEEKPDSEKAPYGKDEYGDPIIVLCKVCREIDWDARHNKLGVELEDIEF